MSAAHVRWLSPHQVMPAATLLVPSRRSGAGAGAGPGSELAAEVDIAAGARAFVRAAVGLALGECASERGPSCIVGDARMARLYAEATAGSGGGAGQGEPHEAPHDGADDADLDLYPDI